MGKTKKMSSLPNRFRIFLKLQFQNGFKRFTIFLLATLFFLYLVTFLMRNFFKLKENVFQDISTETAIGSVHSPYIFNNYSAGGSDNKNSINMRLQNANKLWSKSVEARKAYIRSQGGLSKIDPWSVITHVYYWDYFTPSFTCPHLIQRIGCIGNGGKFVCGFELFEKENSNETCIVYSFGVSHESSFEAEFLDRTNCHIFAFDFSVDDFGPEIKSHHRDRAKFYKMGLSDRDEDETFQTLGTIMRKNGHQWIDVLKIDIEESEFPCMEQIMEEFHDLLPFGQLQMEIHVDHFGREFSSVYNWWTKLEHSGLRAFMNEANHIPCVALNQNPVAVEYSFINIKGHHRLLQG